ncbi:MAG: 2-dehydropantoate 2-reductase [Vicinamibacteraceae bacterium]|nr:2-dehydropantoate 2-reductase [Vicinamibacteraceae bacterium]
MRIAIIGPGAVGGYFGARLAAAGHEVLFIARGAHRRAIMERGLLVWSPFGDLVARGAAPEDPSEIGPPDLVILAVKTYDNATALPLLRTIAGPDTVVLTLQNGVDSAEEIATVIGEAPVLGGTAYIAAAIRAPGLIEHTGRYHRIVFGEWFRPGSEPSPRAAAIGAVLTEAGVVAEVVPDARVAIWEKFIYLAPLAAFTAATRLPTGATWNDPVLRAQFMGAVREVVAVGEAEGIPLAAGQETRIERLMQVVLPGMRSSMLIDLSAGKRLEVETLQGAVVRRAARHGVPVPIMTTLYAVLKPWADGPVTTWAS